MRDCQMRWQTNESESVMASLMGFDKLCPKQPSREKQRMLSNAYILKSASIGRRRESLIPNKRLSRKNGDASSDTKKEKDSVPDKHGDLATDKISIRVRRSNVLRCQQKIEHGSPRVDYMSLSLKSQLEMIDKHCHFSNGISVFEVKPRTASDALQEVKWDHRRYREQRESLKPKNREHHSCASCSRTMSRSWLQEERFTKFKDVWIPGYVGNNFTKIKGEEAPGKSHTSLGSIVSTSSNASESSGFGSESSNPKENLQDTSVDDGLIMSDQCKEIDLSQRVAGSTTSNIASHIEIDDSYAILEAPEINGYRNNGSTYSESDLDISSKDSEQQESSNESSEGESPYSNCSKSDTPELRDKCKGHYRLSPDSVLEKFKHFENSGLWKQLQALNIELEETNSEESAIVVSDEEGADPTQVDKCEEIQKVEQWFEDEESKNYSYMVNVLDESTIFGTEHYIDFNSWHTLECPINPSLFETLEIKYGKQISCEKNDRRLLFDRINSGMVSIFDRIVNFHACEKSMKKKYYSCLRREGIEDELWRILSCQEKAKSQDMSEKAVGEWFMFEEGVSILCSELESYLFDELVMEYVSM